MTSRSDHHTLSVVFFGTWLAGVLTTALHVFAAEPLPPLPSPVVASCPAEPDDAWIQRRLQYFEERCGPVPYEVKIWRKGDEEGIDGACGRPARVHRLSVK